MFRYTSQKFLIILSFFLIFASAACQSCYLTDGINSYETGDYDTAISNFNRAVADNPGSAEAYYWRGKTENQKTQYNAAIDDLNKAISIDPKITPAYIERGRAYFGKTAYTNAIDDYYKAIDIDLSLSQSLSKEIAKCYLAQGKYNDEKREYESAISNLDKALILDPKFIDAYEARALVNVHRNDLQNAITDLSSAINNIDSNDTEKSQILKEKRGKLKLLSDLLHDSIQVYGEPLPRADSFPKKVINEEAWLKWNQNTIMKVPEINIPLITEKWNIYQSNRYKKLIVPGDFFNAIWVSACSLVQ